MKIDSGATPSISWQIVAYIALTAAEVMVAIVSLEFSYTQAPKSMKSLIMSLWLAAVFVGNQVTARINDYIQVDNPVAGVVASGNEASHGGFDEAVGSGDDILLVFDAEGKRTDLRFGGRETLDRLLGDLEARISASAFEAPSNADGPRSSGRRAIRGAIPTNTGSSTEISSASGAPVLTKHR